MELYAKLKMSQLKTIMALKVLIYLNIWAFWELSWLREMLIMMYLKNENISLTLCYLRLHLGVNSSTKKNSCFLALNSKSIKDCFWTKLKTRLKCWLVSVEECIKSKLVLIQFKFSIRLWQGVIMPGPLRSLKGVI